MQSGSPKKISCLAVCPSSVLPHISRLISLAHRHHAAHHHHNLKKEESSSATPTQITKHGGFARTHP